MIALILLEVIFLYINIKAKKWQKTNGSIISDDVNIDWNALMVSKLEYRYFVAGIEYKSKRIAYATLGSVFTVLKEKYIKSNEVVVYYYPDNPSASVIIPGFRLFHLIHFSYLFGLLLLSMNLDAL